MQRSVPVELRRAHRGYSNLAESRASFSLTSSRRRTALTSPDPRLIIRGPWRTFRRIVLALTCGGSGRPCRHQVGKLARQPFEDPTAHPASRIRPGVSREERGLPDHGARPLPKKCPTQIDQRGLPGTSGEAFSNDFLRFFKQMARKAAYRFNISPACSGGFESRPLR